VASSIDARAMPRIVERMAKAVGLSYEAAFLQAAAAARFVMLIAN
jgi:hypothetical protein